jgi:Flp pilus assembly protein TadG
VETAISCSLLFSILFGILIASLALYVSNFVSEAAKEATRYAAIRGFYSCTDANKAFPDCNLNPTTSGNAIQTHIQSLGYPFASGITAQASWFSPTSSGTWSQACTGATDTVTGSLLANTACNFPGHAVQVQVTYNFPFSIPFVPAQTLNISSSSQMVISE